MKQMQETTQENPAFPAFKVGDRVEVLVSDYDSIWWSSHPVGSIGEITAFKDLRETQDDVEFIFAYRVKVGTLRQWLPFNELQKVGE
jgi:hypothetical protein